MGRHWSDTSQYGKILAKHIRWLDKYTMNKLKETEDPDTNMIDHLSGLTEKIARLITAQMKVIDTQDHAKRIQDIESIISAIPADVLKVAKQKAGV